MYIVNVNNFRPFDLFILLNAAFRNSNIAFSHAALDICLRRAYNALKRTVRQCPSGSYGDAKAAAGYNYKAYFVIPLFICVDGGRKTCGPPSYAKKPLKLRMHQNILHKNDCMSIPYHADQSCKRCLLIGCQRQKRICKAVYTFLSHCLIS